MSGCGTFKCPRRLYEGHGTSSYRPSNPEMAAENQARLAQIQAERDAQDRIWGGSGGSPSYQSLEIPKRKIPVLTAQEKSENSDTYIAKPVWPKN